MDTEKTSRPSPQEWQRAADMLLEVQRILVDSIASGSVEESDHHIVGLPSGVEGSTPGGARIEAALHAIMGARHLIRQAASGAELPGVTIIERAQKNFALAGGYVAAIWSTELSEQVDKRSK